MGKFLDHRPLMIWPNGNNNVKPFSARAFDETLEPHFRKPSFEFARRFRQSLPFDRQVGIEIEDDAIGLSKRFIVRAPRMDFQHAHLRQPNQPLAGIDGEIVLFLLALCDRESKRSSLQLAIQTPRAFGKNKACYCHRGIAPRSADGQQCGEADARQPPRSIRRVAALSCRSPHPAPCQDA